MFKDLKRSIELIKKSDIIFKIKRRSFTPYFSIAALSIPIPKAKPVYFLLSILHASRTFGCTIPQPNISSQPVYLQTLQPFPPQILQLTSISAEGSVNGKYEGLRRIWFLFQTFPVQRIKESASDRQMKHFHQYINLQPDEICNVPVAEIASFRKTLPGEIVRIGGF